MQTTTRTPDKYDLKAEQVHGAPRVPGSPVTITGIDVSFGAIFRIVLAVSIAQGFLVAIGLVILLAVGVL